MKIAITGHTKGIGKSISDYFIRKNYDVTGFSRSNGYNISNSESQKIILEQLDNFDIFVNNAFNNFDDSQKLLLKAVLNHWEHQEKIIINISSRWTDGNHQYCVHKQSLDQLCEKYKNSKVYVVNLKPGLTDTVRVGNIEGLRMRTEDIISVIDFVLANVDNFKVHSIAFGK